MSPLSESINTFLKEEENCLTDLLRVARLQSEAIRAKDGERMMALVQERERIGLKSQSIYRDRIKVEEELLRYGADAGIMETLKEKDALVRLASEIIELDQKNSCEIVKRMGDIKKNLLALDQARSLKEAYLGGTSVARGEAIFINKHQ